jgi:succinoglycan biosynthesis transport protein ExoP
MTEERNHATLRDYLLTLRRRKFVILGIVIVAAVVAGALAASQAKTYTAQSSLQALDLSQSAGFADLLQSQQNVPQATAAQLSQTATRPEIMLAIKRRLHLPDSVDQIRSKLAISQDQQSNFVLITATSSDAPGAAALANTAANAVADLSNSAVRTQYAVIARRDSNEATTLLAPFAGRKLSQLSSNDQARFQANTQEAQQLGQLAARVLAFSRAASVAQVTSQATVPTAPAGPHPVSSAILGAIAGLVLALIVVAILESMDHRLRRPDEAEAVLGLPYIGAVPKGSLGMTPGGKGDPLNISAFRMIRTNLRFLATSSDESEEMRSILVTSPMSGEGKTTVSFGLAMSSAASGLNTLLIEADVHRPVHAKRLGLASGPGLADYLRGGISPGEILQTYRFTDPTSQGNNGGSSNGVASTLTCITAGSSGSLAAAQVGGEKFAQMIAEVTKAYDLVVIDSAPLLAVAETSEMVALVDAVAVCVRMGATTVEHARAAKAAFDRLPPKPKGLVLTDLPRDIAGYYGYAYEYSSKPEKTGARG